jgi:catechol 2,3-dioxygenase-like lactoylglutathione lyase family enzyme
MTTGIHHITAISGEIARTLDFYVHALGLRLVKRTVNYDDPGTSTTLCFEDLPIASRSALFGTESARANTSINSAFAAPSAGGAANATSTFNPSHRTTRLRDARGFAKTVRRTTSRLKAAPPYQLDVRPCCRKSLQCLCRKLPGFFRS